MTASRDTLKLTPYAASRTAKIDEIGGMEHWSTDGLCRQLCLLEGLVP